MGDDPNNTIMNRFPIKWFIPLQEDEGGIIKSWWLEKASRWGRIIPHDAFVMSEHPIDHSYYWSGSDSALLESHPSYQRITIEQFREITNPHPKKWCIEATEENYAELQRWRLSVAREWTGSGDFRVGQVLLSKHPYDHSYYFADPMSVLRDNEDYNDYQEITLEQFRQITKSTPNQKAMSKSIQISRELLDEYYEASTSEQKDYLVEHFKLDGTTTDEAIRGLHGIACSTWKKRIKKNHPDCFQEESKYFDFSEAAGEEFLIHETIIEKLGLHSNFIQVRNSTDKRYHRKSFYLSSSYNWELASDGDIQVLIPTKKD